MLKNKNQKSVFDLTDEEEEERLQAVMDRLKREIYAKGLPTVYQDNRCPTEWHFIERYEDGRTFLVLLDIETRRYIPIKELPKD